MSERARLVVMISGSGSNLQALIDAIAAGQLSAEIVAVISNRRAAYGLERAQNAGVPTVYFPLKPYRDDGRGRELYDADLATEVAGYGPDVIVLAGWMHILSPSFLDRFPDKVINLHPALPGQFAGTHGIERTFAAFQAGDVPHGGCMVHVAVPEVDAGPVLAQAIVPIRPTDTVDTFAERMHKTEHKLIILGAQIAIDLN